MEPQNRLTIAIGVLLAIAFGIYCLYASAVFHPGAMRSIEPANGPQAVRAVNFRS
jgi:hypothetical protein